jgi:hypothetical protein
MKPLKAAERSAESRLRATVVGRKLARKQRQEGSRRREASWIPAKGKLWRVNPRSATGMKHGREGTGKKEALRGSKKTCECRADG